MRIDESSFRGGGACMNAADSLLWRKDKEGGGYSKMSQKILGSFFRISNALPMGCTIVGSMIGSWVALGKIFVRSCVIPFLC